MREIQFGVPYPLEYKAVNGFDAVCEIRLFQHNGKTVVVATDVDVGPSVTNSVEQIATLLRQRGIGFDFFCEHYFGRGEAAPRGDETFDWVTFSWDGAVAIRPHWKAGSREQLEALIGCAFR